MGYCLDIGLLFWPNFPKHTFIFLGNKGLFWTPQRKILFESILFDGGLRENIWVSPLMSSVLVRCNRNIGRNKSKVLNFGASSGYWAVLVLNAPISDRNTFIGTPHKKFSLFCRQSWKISTFLKCVCVINQTKSRPVGRCHKIDVDSPGKWEERKVLIVEIWRMFYGV